MVVDECLCLKRYSLTFKSQIKLAGLERDKHSSLFCLIFMVVGECFSLKRRQQSYFQSQIKLEGLRWDKHSSLFYLFGLIFMVVDEYA